MHFLMWDILQRVYRSDTMYESIDTAERLDEIKRLTSGYLINCHSDVNNRRHVVHILPLTSLCKPEAMKISSNYPKKYAVERADLATLGVQEEAWVFGRRCCQRRAAELDDT